MKHECYVCGYECDCGADPSVELCWNCSICSELQIDIQDDEPPDWVGEDDIEWDDPPKEDK